MHQSGSVVQVQHATDDFGELVWVLGGEIKQAKCYTCLLLYHTVQDKMKLKPLSKVPP